MSASSFFFRVLFVAGTLAAGVSLGAVAHAASEYPSHTVPDDALTLGAIDPRVTPDNIQRTICRPNWVRNARPSTSYLQTVKGLYLKRSDLADKRGKSYVIDFRIPLSVGGHPTDPGNLWPQPVGAEWNAAAKDKLETYVQREVCAGRISLADGQEVFRKNWVDVFHLYCGPDPKGPCNPPGTPAQIQTPK
jgi:hypothetical protein